MKLHNILLTSYAFAYIIMAWIMKFHTGKDKNSAGESPRLFSLRGPYSFRSGGKNGAVGDKKTGGGKPPPYSAVRFPLSS